MNIAIAIERYDPAASGVERSTQQVADGLILRGHTVTIITGEAPADVTLAGGQIINGDTVDFRHRINISRFARWAPQTLEKQNADITLSMTMNCPGMIVAPRSGILAERLLREKVAKRFSSSKQNRSALNWLNLPMQSALRRERSTADNPMVKKFIAISDYVARQLTEHHQIPPEKIATIANGSLLPVVTPEERAAHRRTVRDGFAIPHDASVVLFLAQHSSHLKGIEPLLKATRKLIDQGTIITLMLAGHIPYRDQLQVAELNLRDHVRMIGPTNQLTALLSAADLTALPSFFDPASKIVYESLMMGVPVVTSKYNGSSDCLMNDAGRDCGCVIQDPCDTDELANAITAMIAPASAPKCMEHTEHWRDAFSMIRHVDALESLMSQTIGH